MVVATMLGCPACLNAVASKSFVPEHPFTRSHSLHAGPPLGPAGTAHPRGGFKAPVAINTACDAGVCLQLLACPRLLLHRKLGACCLLLWLTGL